MAPNVNLNLALKADLAPGAVLAADPRADLAAQFIPAGTRVLDLSDNTALQHFLPNGCSYLGRDRITCDGGAVCNIPAGDFPTQAAANSDIVVMLGALERIADVETFFTHLRFCKLDVILSYSATDLGGDRDGFANAFNFYDLALLFDRFGFRIECTAPIDAGQVLIRLTPIERLKPVAACSVAVIADGDCGTFGGRLGGQMINALLPGQADIHHLSFDTLNEAHDKYDLVILGTGGSLFQPLLGDGVLDIVSRGKAAIGIFGTQYRELIPRVGLERLLERLDTWYARYEDDVLMYGRGRPNVVHLGDWLIDRFMMNTPTLDVPLQIVEEVRPDHALDRAMQVIQCHRQVHSTLLAPLLCALTAAELAAYADQPSEQLPGVASGTFRSMLIDIFGRSYPEKQFFMVDRDAVRRYKARVHRNVAGVAERIDSMLRNVAVAAA
ncbi:MAG: hypothetical protein ACREB8_17735 [Pseudolabrys sp.]